MNTYVGTYCIVNWREKLHSRVNYSHDCMMSVKGKSDLIKIVKLGAILSIEPYMLDT